MAPSRSLAWWLLLPLLSGIGAYQIRTHCFPAEDDLANPGPPPQQQGEEQHPPKPASPAISDPLTAFAEIERQFQSQLARERKPPFEPKDHTAAELQAEIVKAKEAPDRRPDWWNDRDATDSAEELGRREGKEGAAWLESIEPRLLNHYLAGWVSVDPSGVLDYLAACKKHLSDSGGIISVALSHACAQGPEALAEAVRRIPWPLWEPFDDRYEFPISTPFGTMLFVSPMPEKDQPAEVANAASLDPKKPELKRAYEVWLDSGAARYLEERGVPLFGFFLTYAQLDPDRALAEWSSWNLTPEMAANTLIGIGFGTQDQEHLNQKLRALSSDPKAVSQLIKAATYSIRKNHDRTVWEQLLPEIAAQIPEVETFEPEH